MSKRKPIVKKKAVKAKSQTVYMNKTSHLPVLVSIPLDKKPRLLVWDEDNSNYAQVSLDDTERNAVIQHLMNNRGVIQEKAVLKESGIAKPDTTNMKSDGGPKLGAYGHRIQDLYSQIHKGVTLVNKASAIFARLRGEQPTAESPELKVDPGNLHESMDTGLKMLDQVNNKLEELLVTIGESI